MEQLHPQKYKVCFAFDIEYNIYFMCILYVSTDSILNY